MAGLSLGLSRLAPNRRSSGLGSVSADSTGKIHTATGLVPGTQFIVYGNGTSLGSALVDGTGKAVVILASAPPSGAQFTYGETVAGGLAPTASLTTLTLRDGTPLTLRDGSSLLLRAA